MAVGVDDVGMPNASSTPREPVEHRYRQLLEHSPYPMCVHADGRVVYVNPAGVRAMAATCADDLVGAMITDFVHPDSIAPMLARIADLHSEGDHSPASEAVMRRCDGSPVDAEVVSVLTSWNGKPAYQVIFRDLTMQKAAEATLRYQAALVTHATDAIIATTSAGIVTSWNPAAGTIYGRSAARALALPISEAVGAAVDPAEIVAGGGVQHAVHRAADGTALIVRAVRRRHGKRLRPRLLRPDRAATRRTEIPDRRGFTGRGGGGARRPWSARVGQSRRSAHPRLAVRRRTAGHDDMSAAFPLYDVDGKAHSTTGTGSSWSSLTSRGRARYEIVGFDRPDGARRWLSVSCRLLDPAETGQQALLASFTDITDQRDAQLRLSHQAHHDSLTGLPNRAYAEAQATEALQADPPTLAAVMFIDLDNVKTVNDGFGHHAGDIVIKTAAQRLQDVLRSGDLIARHGGDEFVALLFGNADHSALSRLAERLHAALAAPIEVAGYLVPTHRQYRRDGGRTR